MFHVVLYQPEMPPNTGNVIRLCAIRPLGFELDDRRLRRAGLDYHEYTRVQVHDSVEAFVVAVDPPRILACSTRGRTAYGDVAYHTGDALLFGPETRGLPAALLESLPPAHRLRIPMLPDNRSLNLSNAVAIILYEAWRQNGYAGSA